MVNNEWLSRLLGPADFLAKLVDLLIHMLDSY